MIIPQIDKAKYGALYDALNSSNVAATAPQVMNASYQEDKPEKTPLYHRVQRGETLSDIADDYSIDVQDLKAWNHLHSNKAVVGKNLRLTEAAADQPEERLTKGRRSHVTYKVKSGDTLRGIASKFDGVSVEQIKSLNGLKKSRLQPGMTIRI